MNRGPLPTLGGVVALFVLMFVVNVANSQPSAPPYGVPSADAAPNPAPEPNRPPPPPLPLPTAPPSPTIQPTATPEPSATRAYPNQVGYAGRTRDGSTAVAVAVLNGRAAA